MSTDVQILSVLWPGCSINLAPVRDYIKKPVRDVAWILFKLLLDLSLVAEARTMYFNSSEEFELDLSFLERSALSDTVLRLF
jgi:hypothetical protein